VQSTTNIRTIVSMPFNTITRDDTNSYIRCSGYTYWFF